MKLLVAIFGTGVYFYSAPILFQYGYDSYFGIPASFIEPSIRDNIIFFFDLSRIVGHVAQNVSFWIWVGLVLLTLIIWFLISLQIIRGASLTVCLLALTGLSLFGFYSFGSKTAEDKTEFQFIPDGCLGKQEKIIYVVPSFYQTTALIVPVYSDTKKMIGGFLTRGSAEIGCDIQRGNIGPLVK